MGWWNSRIEKAEMVVRCKGRKGYMKDLVKARQSFSGAHGMYLRSLRNTGSALLEFVTAETRLHHHHHHHHNQGLSGSIEQPPLNPSPPHPPRMSTSSTPWCTTSTLPPPPPPPPPVSSSVWDFFDPFLPTSGRIDFKDEWEDATTTVSTSSVAADQSNTAPAADSNVVAEVVYTNSKELEEIIKELDECFINAADSGGPPSLLLEVPSTFPGQRSSSGRFHLVKWNVFGNFCEKSNDIMNVGVAGSSHCSTVERLYESEKKLYLEVKNAEALKLEHVKKFDQLRKLELKSVDNLKTETAKKELEMVESRMEVNSHAIESTSAEITKLREEELYPQIVELVKGLFCMWRSMYECHHKQTHIVEQFKYLNTIPSSEPTSEIHRQSALRLELQVQQWHLSFNNLVKAQRDYVQSLTGWLRLSLFQFSKKPIEKSSRDSMIHSLCEDWELAVNNDSSKVASEGITSFYSMINAIVLSHTEELKQKKRFEATFKMLERKNAQLNELESKYGHYSIDASSSRNKNSIREKRAKMGTLTANIETLREKAEEERAKYDKLLNVTRTMTKNNLEMGLPRVFETLTEFANIYKHGFEPVYNQAKHNGA